jgi:hypothetical protein
MLGDACSWKIQGIFAKCCVLNRFPQMLENVGLYGSAGIVAALMVAASIIPTIFLQWRGKALY